MTDEIFTEQHNQNDKSPKLINISREWISNSIPLQSYAGYNKVQNMKSNFSEYLTESANNTGSLLSVGYDPAPVEFPIEGISGYDSELPSPIEDFDSDTVSDQLVTYFNKFANEFEQQSAKCSCFKLNLGYFIMFDSSDHFAGTNALIEILDTIDSISDVPVVLDVKDADIARSSGAYAISKLKLDHVDAITVHPYMGTDSVEPFLQFAHQRGQGVYVLTRTTNPGAEDFQELDVFSDRSESEEDKLYIKVARKIVDWASSYPGTVGSVAAGNDLDELFEIASIFAEQDPDIPLLIPGVGNQGGKAGQVIETLEAAGYNQTLARINSSSGIMYRAQKDDLPHTKHASASVEEINRLNNEIDASTNTSR